MIVAFVQFPTGEATAKEMGERYLCTLELRCESVGPEAEVVRGRVREMDRVAA